MESSAGLVSREQLLRSLGLAIDAARREGTCLAVLVVGLDQFSQINRTLGREVGDELVDGAGERLLRWTRASDVVADLGAGRFAVVLVGMRNATSLSRRLEDLVDDMVMTVGPAGRRRRVTVSIGGTAGPMSASSAEDVLNRADEAMGRVSAAGGNGCELLTSGP